MYKVFFNDSTIEISSEVNKSSNNNIVQIVESECYRFVNQFISAIKYGTKVQDCLILTQEIIPLWDYFRNQFKEIPAAGGLVQNNEGHFLFIRRLGVWDLPKGKIEKKETSENAALREVEEECGLSGVKIIKPLDSTFHIYKSPYLPVTGNLVLKETRWYLMNYSGSATPVPQTEEDIEEVRWVTLSELDNVMANTYSSLRELLQKSVPLI